MLPINKKLLIILIISFGLQILYASTLSKDEIQKQSKDYLKRIGITTLDGELKIVPAKTLITNSKDNYYSNQIKTYLKMQKEQEKNGFIREAEPRVKELLDFNHTANYQYKKFKNEVSATSTHLRHNISELKMAYTFIGVPESKIDKNIGVAPYGAFKQIKYGDENDGWDGAVQFFEKNEIGTCEFKEHNFKLAHGGIELVKELVSYDVFGKPTIVLTKGNADTGFLYQISWYDNIFSRELSCAAKNFSITTKNNVLELAKAIDQAQ